VNSKHWTAAATAKLRALAKTGKSFKQIGEILGYSRNACIGKARREKIAKAPTDLAPRPKAFVKPEARPFRLIIRALKPAPIPPDVKVADMPLVTMMQLTSNNCRYPFGEDEDMMFCGKPRHRGRPYCQEHAEVCYKPMPTLTRSVRRL
jgi:GcrA cell cycle regulator